jgi:magnesium transporter
MQRLENIVDSLHLEDLRNEEHPSIFDENDNYDILIIRLPLLGETLKSQSNSFVLTKTVSYMYNRTEALFEELESRFEGPHKILDRKIDKLLKNFSKYPDMVIDLEESLYDDKFSDSLMTQWFELKRDILRVERILIRGVETLQEVITYYEDDENFPLNHYIDLHEHMDRVKRSAALQLSKLDYIYNFYNARTNERMNRLIYVLTIISAIFLPLNLIVGFFGMNTGGLPFTQNGFGTFNVVLIISVTFVVVSGLLYFIRKKS